MHARKKVADNTPEFESSKSDINKRKSSDAELEQQPKRAKQEDTPEYPPSQAFSMVEPSEARENTYIHKLSIFFCQILSFLGNTLESLDLESQAYIVTFIFVCLLFTGCVVIIPLMLYYKYKPNKKNKSENVYKQHNKLKPVIKVNKAEIRFKSGIPRSPRRLTKSYVRLRNRCKNSVSKPHTHPLLRGGREWLQSTHPLRRGEVHSYYPYSRRGSTATASPVPP